MSEIGKNRCILYFDELDKSCAKHGGSTNEISSILIHLTDPNMNKTFQDRFFQGIDFPLDNCIIMTSFNDKKLVDPILLDRFIDIEVKNIKYNGDNLYQDNTIWRRKDEVYRNSNDELIGNIMYLTSEYCINNPNYILSDYSSKLETNTDPIILGMTIIGKFRDILIEK
jgi:hypothetical protein